MRHILLQLCVSSLQTPFFFHGPALAIHELLGGVDATQEQDGRANGGFEQHREVATSRHGQDHPPYRDAQDQLFLGILLRRRGSS
jgi:hypothetical protein